MTKKAEVPVTPQGDRVDDVVVRESHSEPPEQVAASQIAAALAEVNAPIPRLPYVSQYVSYEYKGKLRAAVIVGLNGTSENMTADLQVFMPVQADRDNPGMVFVQNVRISDFDF